jgi:hypothetical protein
MYDFKVGQILIKQLFTSLTTASSAAPRISLCSEMLGIEPMPVAGKKSYIEVVLYQQTITKRTGKIANFLFKIFCLVTNVLPHLFLKACVAMRCNKRDY